MTAHIADKSSQPSQPPPPPLPPNQKKKQKTLKAGKRISLFFFKPRQRSKLEKTKPHDVKNYASTTRCPPDQGY